MRKFYTKLINIGIPPDIDNISARRLRLINTTILYFFALAFVNFVRFLLAQQYFFMLVIIASLLLIILSAFLSFKKKHGLAAVLAISSGTLLTSLLSILTGVDINLEAYLIVFLLVSFIAFDKKKQIIFISLWILINYVFITVTTKYSFFAGINPAHPYAEAGYWITTSFLFIVLFLLFWSFAIDNNKLYNFYKENNKLHQKEVSFLFNEIRRKTNQVALSEIIEDSLDNTIPLNTFLQNTLEKILNISWLSIKSEGAIFLKNQEGNLEMTARKNMSNSHIKHCSLIKPGECLCGQALEQKKPFIGDFRTKFEQNDTVISYIHMKMPIILGKEVLGLLNLYLDKEVGIKDEDITFFEHICTALANIIKTKQLQTILKNEKQEQEALNQRLFAQSLAAEQQNIELEEQKKELVAVQENLSYEKKEQEVLNQKLFAQSLAAQQQNIELKEQKEELIATQKALNDSHQKTATNFKYLQKSIEKNEDYEAFLEANTDLIFMLNTSGRILYLNKRIEDFGYTKGELIEKSFIQYFPKEEASKNRERLKSAFLKELKPFETLILQKDKSVKPVEITGRHLLRNNKYVLIGTVRDITERKEAQKALQASEQHARLAQEAGKIGTWEWHIKTKKLIWSDTTYKIFGLTGVKKLITVDDYFDFVHQEDKQRLFDELDAAIKVKKTEHKTEYRIIRNGELAWLSEESKIILDKDGELSKMIGVVQDITKAKNRNETLLESKNKIEKAHRKITSSINYAKTIQDALLTHKELIGSYFNKYFVLFLPRDGVSGDFYYVNKIGKYLVFAVADCTGHGVPGAFLTMLGITYLHEIVRRDETDNPGLALNFLRTRVKDTFSSFGTQNQNGLDIALCAINIETNILNYAGAYNPLWIVRNNELIIYKGTRNPIGFYPKEISFENHEMQLKNNDKIYLFSDGYRDQFGGKLYQKFTSRRFKKLIMTIHSLPMEEQNVILKQTLKKWQGTKEQIDDITVMGIQYQC